MTSLRTTSERRLGRDAARPGFTLVELLLVLVIVTLLAAIVAPRLGSTLTRVRLDSAAETLRTEWAAARLEAIRLGEPVAFRCTLGTGDFQLTKLANLGQPVAGQAADRPAAESSEPQRLSDAIFRQLSLEGDGVTPIDPTVPAVIVFQPDGRTRDAFAVIESEDGRQRRVTLRGLTGASRVEAATPGSNGAEAGA